MSKMVVIPKFVAKFIEELREKDRDYPVFAVIGKLYNVSGFLAKGDIRYWLDGNREHQELFLRAWLDGYKVDATKIYTVKIKATGDVLEFRDGKVNFSNICGRDEISEYELKDAGLDWVLSDEHFEVKEV